MLSIMGGEWRGRRLEAPDHGPGLRPTAGRVKQTIFNILESIRLKQNLPASLVGIRVLDLYAGVGGLGLEALSRGADHCIFVEKDAKHIRALKNNILSLGATSRSLVIHDDAANPKAKWQESIASVGLVFLDPPYEMPGVAGALAVLENAGLSAGCQVVFEHHPDLNVAVPSQWQIHSQRKLGPAGLSVFLLQK